MPRLNEILRAVSFAAEGLREESWAARLPQVLEHLGQATAVDRVYVFENHRSSDGVALTSQRYEWAKPGVAPQIDNADLQNLPVEDAGVADWMQALASGRSVVALTKNLPEPKFTLLYKMQGIVSIVLVPIFIGSDPWGYMGFDDCTRERVWQSQELDALKAGANILGAFLQREKLQNALEEIKTLRGILPICANCKKIRDDQGSWEVLESYIRDRSDVEFSHGLCPECAKKLYPELG